jgi:glycerophosphoryl diester phosphodiesterase
MRITIVGHRGARGLSPENTIESIDRALDCGVTVIEYDLRLTADNDLILHHDATLEKTYQDHRPISQLTVSELKSIGAKHNVTIPTFNEVLSHVPDKIHHLVELKDPDTSLLLLQQLYAHDHQKKRVAITTIEWENLKDLQNTREFIRIFAASRWHPFRALAQQADGITIRWWMLTPFLYWRARKQDKLIFVYTVNSRLIMRFVDLFYPQLLVATDRPNRFAVR